jgi:uncharacterized protein YutE (UPF0331/DUF86 family)
MVDSAVLAKKVAAIRDAVARIREVLPDSVEAFRVDRTAREIVLLNLFIGLQESIAIAMHWLADEGWDVPQSYGEAFMILADRRILEHEVAARLRVRFTKPDCPSVWCGGRRSDFRPRRA